MSKLDRLIIENQSEDGSIGISDQRAMRDEIKQLFLDIVGNNEQEEYGNVTDNIRNGKLEKRMRNILREELRNKIKML